jgi:CubicO group peptidase (beta-lactamase class C family)
LARWRVALFGWLALTACASPAPEPPAGDAPSPQASDPAPVQTTPGAADVRFADAAAYSAERTGRAFLVMQAGRVVYEAGQNGHDAATPQRLYEGTESFWGVLAAVAAEDALIDLDEPVAATLPSFAGERWKREVRVHELLDFTSGLEAGVVALSDPAAGDLYARALELGMVSRPGERFQYGPSHLTVFAALLARKLEAAGRDPDPVAYLRERLLDRLEVSVAHWERDAAGNPDPAAGASLSARDWARFGGLLTAGGPEHPVLGACFRGSRANPGFGLALWLNTPRPPREGAPGWSVRDPTRSFYPHGLPDLVVAAGRDNQRLYAIPSLDLVVVRFGDRDRRFRDEELLARLARGIGAPAQP